ncbi:MAG: class I SAM-dependent methyltransferase [Solirubrobacterales bacterium]
MGGDASTQHDKSRQYYEAERADMLKYIPQNARRTLEFGCGYGRFSALLKDTLHTESWAVEVDEQAAREASRSLDRVIHADAFAAMDQLPENHFDCVIFFDILEHLVDPYSLLRAVKSKLAPHGVVVASIPNIRYYSVFKDFVVHGNWEYRDQGVMDRTHLRFFTRKSIRAMFERLGFGILTMEGIHPTSSRTYRWLNRVLCNTIADVRYKHYAVIAAPATEE